MFFLTQFDLPSSGGEEMKFTSKLLLQRILPLYEFSTQTIKNRLMLNTHTAK